MLKISEIFYSLQGEGSRAGTANIFIRVQGCDAKMACAKFGINCDTEFNSGREYELDELREFIQQFNCQSIIWTGGEPATQITTEVTSYFDDYFQAIETSGLFPLTGQFDYVVVSPKVADHIVARNFKHVSELRYVRHKGQQIPQPEITATDYYISPHSDADAINPDNLAHCIQLCLDNPKWRLSVQQHKLWGVL